jgi:hypothetical protein
MVGADGLGSKEDVRVLSLIVPAQFVWRVSPAAIPSAASASGGTSGSNAPTLSCCSEGPGGMCGNASRLLWGQWSTADGIRPGPSHREAGRIGIKRNIQTLVAGVLYSPETLKPVHHFPAPGPLATEGGGVDGK